MKLFCAPGFSSLADEFSAADAYLFVMARGAAELGFPLPDAIGDYISRIESRPSVREAARREA